ncbi:MAG TPA: hypothetical protein VFG10_14745 [Saprospiraceae bacterium]|nr:hypothetical protein [Saprospiraceae bacterium]
MSSFLNRISNWKTLLGLLIIYFLFPSVWFRHAGEKISQLAGKEIGPVDLTFGFNPKRTLQMIEDYGEAGRTYYRFVEMTIDIIYPIVYCTFFAVLLTMIYRSLLRGPVKYLNMVPFAAMVFDFLENISIVSMINHYPEQSIFIATLCELFKMLKWLMFGLVLFLVIFGLFKVLTRKRHA